MIKTAVTYNSKLSEIEKRFAIPLVEIAQRLVPGMIARIRQGRSSTGTFSAIGAHSVPRPGSGLFWVSPKAPQPNGYVVKATHGDYAGWAGYRSYRDYADALGNPPRDFDDTGALLSSLKIRVNGPGRVKVAFYGAHAADETPTGKGQRRANSAVAYLASRNEPVPMLTPSRDEIVQVAQLFQSEVGAQVIGEAADAQQIRGMGQRLTRAQKRLSAAASGRR